MKEKFDPKKISQCYNDWSQTYDKDSIYNPSIVKNHPIILKLLKTEKNLDTGLELGCGTGILTQKISKYAKEIYGLDFNEKMLALARKKKTLGGRMIFKNADITKTLDFSNNYFNFVVAPLVLCHLKDREPVYKEIHRVLKPSGVFVFDEFTSKVNESFEIKYKEHLGEYHDKGYAIWIDCSVEQNLAMLKKSGFKIDRIVKTKVTKEFANCIGNYEANKGCPFTTIFKVRK